MFMAQGEDNKTWINSACVSDVSVTGERPRLYQVISVRIYQCLWAEKKTWPNST